MVNTFLLSVFLSPVHLPLFILHPHLSNNNISFIICLLSNQLREFTRFRSHNSLKPISTHVGGANALVQVTLCLCVHRPHFKLEWRPLSAVRRLPAVTANQRKHTESTEGKRRIHEGDRRLFCSSIISHSTDGPSVRLTMEIPTKTRLRSAESATETAVPRSCPCRRTAKGRSPR